MTVACAAEGNRGVRTQGFAGLHLTHADVTLDVGEAGPASRQPSLTRPVPAPHPELAQPPAGTRHASPRPEPGVLHERLLQAANGLVVPARRGQQHTLVLYRAGAGPRVRQLVGRVVQAGNVARQQPLGVLG